MMFLFKDGKKRNLSNEIIFRYFFVKPYKFNVKNQKHNFINL